ncbi:hypothetical protein BN1088_1431685 [Sphingobacterium sp. PM2-P1-29]|nr:hypothetical protein BN1088_1431685 [Sphingobacterium sp. PM2-P1-29]
MTSIFERSLHMKYMKASFAFKFLSLIGQMCYYPLFLYIVDTNIDFYENRPPIVHMFSFPMRFRAVRVCFAQK